MKTLWIAALAALPLVAGSASAQFGQYPVPNWGPGYRGNISPYLNILRGTNTGIDYYLGTRSEQQRRANAQQFRDELDSLPARNRVLGEELSETSPGKPIPSGAYSVFNNTGGYFNNTAGAFAYPNQQLSPSGVRPGTQASPSRRAGAAPRSGASPGFPSRPAGR
ncbi:MAG: hypothetical protein U0797_07140 [Gemmataceae bacterium]